MRTRNSLVQARRAFDAAVEASVDGLDKAGGFNQLSETNIVEMNQTHSSNFRSIEG